MDSPHAPAAAIGWPPEVPLDADVAPAALHLPDAALPAPEMTRQERVIFTVYVVMAGTIVAFLAATVVLWLVGS